MVQRLQRSAGFPDVMKTGVYDSYGLYSNSEYDSLIDSLTGENDNANALRFTRSWKICWLHRIVVLHRCTTLIKHYYYQNWVKRFLHILLRRKPGALQSICTRNKKAAKQKK